MLIGRTKHILYIKIQASSDNNRISFFKKRRRRKKKTNILVMCYDVSCFWYVYIIKVRVYFHKIDCPLQLSVSINGALASLIRLMQSALRERLRTHKVFTKDQRLYLNYNKFSIKSYVLSEAILIHVHNI